MVFRKTQYTKQKPLVNHVFNLEKRKNRNFGYSDAFGGKPSGFSHFPKATCLLKHSLDVLQAFSNRETHSKPGAGS